MFSYISPEQRVRQDHPLRSLRAMTDEALRYLQRLINKLYAKTGRASIAPEKLLRGSARRSGQCDGKRSNRRRNSSTEILRVINSTAVSRSSLSSRPL